MTGRTRSLAGSIDALGLESIRTHPWHCHQWRSIPPELPPTTQHFFNFRLFVTLGIHCLATHDEPFVALALPFFWGKPENIPRWVFENSLISGMSDVSMSSSETGSSNAVSRARL